MYECSDQLLSSSCGFSFFFFFKIKHQKLKYSILETAWYSFVFSAQFLQQTTKTESSKTPLITFIPLTFHNQHNHPIMDPSISLTVKISESPERLLKMFALIGRSYCSTENLYPCFLNSETWSPYTAILFCLNWKNKTSCAGCKKDSGKGMCVYTSVSQPPGRGPVPCPGINYTGPREILLEFVILVF